MLTETTIELGEVKMVEKKEKEQKVKEAFKYITMKQLQELEAKTRDAGTDEVKRFFNTKYLEKDPDAVAIEKFYTGKLKLIEEIKKLLEDA